MGCENIQSFTIPGAVFAQIWGGGGGPAGWEGAERGTGFFWCLFFYLKKKQLQVISM